MLEIFFEQYRKPNQKQGCEKVKGKGKKHKKLKKKIIPPYSPWKVSFSPRSHHEGSESAAKCEKSLRTKGQVNH
jgi:hypothetical protein